MSCSRTQHSVFGESRPGGPSIIGLTQILCIPLIFVKVIMRSPASLVYYYRSTSLSQSPREWRKYFELSEVRHSQNVTSPKYSIHVEFR